MDQPYPNREAADAPCTYPRLSSSLCDRILQKYPRAFQHRQINVAVHSLNSSPVPSTAHLSPASLALRLQAISAAHHRSRPPSAASILENDSCDRRYSSPHPTLQERSRFGLSPDENSQTLSSYQSYPVLRPDMASASLYPGAQLMAANTVGPGASISVLHNQDSTIQMSYENDHLSSPSFGDASYSPSVHTYRDQRSSSSPYILEPPKSALSRSQPQRQSKGTKLKALLEQNRLKMQRLLSSTPTPGFKRSGSSLSAEVSLLTEKPLSTQTYRRTGLSPSVSCRTSSLLDIAPSPPPPEFANSSSDEDDTAPLSSTKNGSRSSSLSVENKPTSECDATKEKFPVNNRRWSPVLASSQREVVGIPSEERSADRLLQRLKESLVARGGGASSRENGFRMRDSAGHTNDNRLPGAVKKILSRKDVAGCIGNTTLKDSDVDSGCIQSSCSSHDEVLSHPVPPPRRSRSCDPVQTIFSERRMRPRSTSSSILKNPNSPSLLKKLSGSGGRVRFSADVAVPLLSPPQGSSAEEETKEKPTLSGDCVPTDDGTQTGVAVQFGSGDASIGELSLSICPKPSSELEWAADNEATSDLGERLASSDTVRKCNSNYYDYMEDARNGATDVRGTLYIEDGSFLQDTHLDDCFSPSSSSYTAEPDSSPERRFLVGSSPERKVSNGTPPVRRAPIGSRLHRGSSRFKDVTQSDDWSARERARSLDAAGVLLGGPPPPKPPRLGSAQSCTSLARDRIGVTEDDVEKTALSRKENKTVALLSNENNRSSESSLPVRNYRKTRSLLPGRNNGEPPSSEITAVPSREQYKPGFRVSEDTIGSSHASPVMHIKDNPRSSQGLVEPYAVVEVAEITRRFKLKHARSNPFASLPSSPSSSRPSSVCSQPYAHSVQPENMQINNERVTPTEETSGYSENYSNQRRSQMTPSPYSVQSNASSRSRTKAANDSSERVGKPPPYPQSPRSDVHEQLRGGNPRIASATKERTPVPSSKKTVRKSVGSLPENSVTSSTGKPSGRPRSSSDSLTDLQGLSRHHGVETDRLSNCESSSGDEMDSRISRVAAREERRRARNSRKMASQGGKASERSQPFDANPINTNGNVPRKRESSGDSLGFSPSGVQEGASQAMENGNDKSPVRKSITAVHEKNRRVGEAASVHHGKSPSPSGGMLENPIYAGVQGRQEEVDSWGELSGSNGNDDVDPYGVRLERQLSKNQEDPYSAGDYEDMDFHSRQTGKERRTAEKADSREPYTAVVRPQDRPPIRERSSEKCRRSRRKSNHGNSDDDAIVESPAPAIPRRRYLEGEEDPTIPSNLSRSKSLSASLSSLGKKMGSFRSRAKRALSNLKPSSSLSNLSRASKDELDGGKRRDKSKTRSSGGSAAATPPIRKPIAAKAIAKFMKSKKDRGVASFSTARYPSAFSPEVDPPLNFRPIGKLLFLNKDGSRLVEFTKPPHGPFGFYIAKPTPTSFVVISRLSDSYDQKLFAGLIAEGDVILDIDGKPTDQFDLKALNKMIASRNKIVLHLKALSTSTARQWPS